jgi:hypothetical protein
MENVISERLHSTAEFIEFMSTLIHEFTQLVLSTIYANNSEPFAVAQEIKLSAFIDMNTMLYNFEQKIAPQL